MSIYYTILHGHVTTGLSDSVVDAVPSKMTSDGLTFMFYCYSKVIAT